MSKGRKPSVSMSGVPREMYPLILPIKTSIDMITGAMGGELKGLSKTATPEEIVGKINEIIARLNASGEAK